ncbi:MAG: deoxynucleoside kinase, partial [Bacteroidia bacterium]|nr:deoxynucleoside kinase [Bacteroidia bacterium]
FTKLFHIINDSLPKPDLFVYLHNSIPKLQENIKKRGRTYEQSISNEYLEKIQNMYFDFIKQLTNTTVLIIECDNVDFVNNTEDYTKLLDAILKPYQMGVTRIVI